MSVSADLRHLLKMWPYDPENDARIITGDDGRLILQVRTPLGIEQYEMEGRPDGQRPHGCESSLEHYLSRLDEARKRGAEQEFELGARDCGELFNEGTLYYFRYVRLFQLKDWTRTIRDTARNIRAFDFIHEYAEREEDRLFLEKWRPYIIRVNATAAAMQALEKDAHQEALKAVREAMARINDLDELDDETFQFERERSVKALSELADQVQRQRPLSELEQLEKQLRRAISRQEFEQAAKLRDRIRALKKQTPG
jgi:hypothetical protein